MSKRPRSSLLRVGRPAGESDLAAFADLLQPALAFPPEFAKRMFADLGNENLLVARRGGRVAGGLAIYPAGQWFGGRSVPMAGIAAVAVAAEHRGRGVGSALAAEALREARRRGFPISTLYPATEPVYRGVGFETAGSWNRYVAKAAEIDLLDEPGIVEAAPVSDPAPYAAVYAQRARATAGNLDRSPFLWARMLRAITDRLYGYVVRGARGGAPEGYVLLTLPTHAGTGRYDVRIRDLCALTPRAVRRLLAFLAAHRSMADEVSWTGPPDDPTVLVLRETPADVLRGRHPWMLRLVDVPAALSARGYAPGVSVEVHLEVRDRIFPGNDGRFVLRVRGSEGSVRRGGRGLVRCSVRGLAPLWTGHLSAEALALAGLVEGSADALAAVTTAFTGPAPWMPEIF